MVTINLPFDEWTEVFDSERLTGALLDRLHPPRPHPGDERRKLPTQAQPGERRLAGFRRTRRRLAHTDAVSSRSQNSGYSTCLRPQVIGQVVHDSSAPVAQLLGAIDRQER